jgi:hypothetical protein
VTGSGAVDVAPVAESAGVDSVTVEVRAESAVVPAADTLVVDCGMEELLVPAGITTGSEDFVPVPGVKSSGADEVLPGSVSAREDSLSAEVTEYSTVESGRESLIAGMMKSGMLLCPLSGTPPSATAAAIPPASTISAAAPHVITDFFKKTPALYRLPGGFLPHGTIIVHQKR